MNKQPKYLPIDITFKDLKYTVATKNGDKVILNNIEGICKSGEITAILGSSGAGKTSLLNGLCQRLQVDQNHRLEGSILANQKKYTSKSFPNFASYVMQDDILPETLTVRECISFAADFKIKGSKEEKEKKVDEVIKTLKLERCQNTLIGGNFIKGVSGGERKRTSIGFELVSNPQVIFLDEPTSGLDSFTAYILINELREYAHNTRKTVIFTIHQPSTDIWQMFDRIILMIHGQIIYQGPGREQILNYFSKNSFVCPHNSNPGDYFLSIMHSESSTNVQNFPTYLENYQQQLQGLVHQEIEQSNVSDLEKRQQVLNIFQQIPLIIKRCLKINFRNPILVKSRTIQSIIMATYIGLIWFQLPDGKNDPTNIVDVQNRAGLIYFLSVSVFMESVNPCVLTFPVDKATFLREENAKLYGQFAYFTGKFLVDILSNLPLPILDTLIAYFMTGLRLETGAFFFYLITMIIMSITGVSVGYFVGTLFKDANTSMSMMPMIVIPFMLFSGFYKNRSDYASWIGWVEYLSPFKYAFQALCINEFEVTYFIPNPIKSYNFEFSKGEALGLLIVYMIIVSMIAFFLLSIFKKKLQ
ncbi:ABC transporter family protein (macronuclear) [Tetrahymena thermophila SB210]|uniref:ABC transporter family protein n=1 Tax=Tetrahymena thermophila (strain SB210) TaxID=312017 RepID=I7MCS0_TETTS|nr:ABC transporter family protein [Tetrahymena thermophila SB210]EAR84815.1 ABC transporter family protein [Tetrahymena thermophila SB210]|eukprot:XP_001032478.1 ABC transporter family protein [Tetrahymena thermophila SB210]